MELSTWLTSTCNQASREEFSIKKVNYSYLCNGHGHKEPFNLTVFLQNGLLFLISILSKAFFSITIFVPVTHLNFSYFHLSHCFYSRQILV